MGQLNMKILMQLEAQKFKQGVKGIENSIKGLMNTFKGLAGALGASLGLASLVSGMKETAVKLSVVQATLKNVSDSTEEYGESLEWLTKIADKYGQNVLSLTNGFAQFHAAAKTSNLSLEQQKTIYEALTRAAGAYHLSAEQTQNVMLAITQMMSKGKVAAEELRRQLGNSLPGAFNIMAKAAGAAGITANGTTAELEEMMKKGKVVASEVLPAFAEELNKATAGADFDSLQSSMNRLSNTWTKFVEKSNFEGMFQGLVNAAESTLNFLTDHFKGFKKVVAGILGGIGFNAIYKSGETSLNELKSKAKSAQDKLINSRLDFLNTKKRLNDVEKKLNAEEAALIKKGYVKDPSKDTNFTKPNVKDETIIKNTKKYNSLLKEQTKLRKELRNLGTDIRDNSFELKELEEQLPTTKFGEIMTKLGKGIVNVFKAVGRAIKAAFSAALFTAAIIALETIIGKVASVIKYHNRLKNAARDVNKEISKVDDEFLDTLTSVKRLQAELLNLDVNSKGRESNIAKLNTYLGLTGDKMLGIKSTAKDIADAIDEWKNNAMESSKAMAAFSLKQDLEKQRTKYEVENAILKGNEDWGKTERAAYMDNFGGMHSYEVLTKEARKLDNEFEANSKELNVINAQLAALDKIIQDNGYTLPESNLTNDEESPETPIAALTKAITKYNNSLEEINNRNKKGFYKIDEDNGINEFKTALSKLYKDTAEDILAIKDLDANINLLPDDGKKAVAKIKAEFAKLKDTSDVEDAINDYKKKLAEINSRNANGFYQKTDDVDEYQNAIDKLNEQAFEDLSAIKNLDNILKLLGNDAQNVFQAIKNGYSVAVKNNKDTKAEKQEESDDKKWEKYKIENDPLKINVRTRDDFFDYAKDQEEIFDELADGAEDYTDKLQAAIDKLKEFIEEHKNLSSEKLAEANEMMQHISDSLEKASKNASDLRTKANIAGYIKDLKAIKQSLNDLHLDNINSVIGGLHNISSGIYSLRNGIRDLAEETNGAEKAWKGLELAFQFTEEILGIIQQVISYMRLQEELTKQTAIWEQARSTAQKKALLEELGLLDIRGNVDQRRLNDLYRQIVAQGALNTEKKTEVGLTMASSAANAQETSTALAAQSAKSGEAIAGATASGAKLAYPWNLIAIATGVAAVIGALASAKKYAGGGIVKGSKFGDHNLIAANGGEMILNENQQSKLWRLINDNKKSNNGIGEVKFKIEGKDLVGTLNNYNIVKRG